MKEDKYMSRTMQWKAVVMLNGCVGDLSSEGIWNRNRVFNCSFVTASLSCG